MNALQSMNNSSELSEMSSGMVAMAATMQGMMSMMQAMSERMNALEREVHMMVKVTPSQAKSLTAAIHERACEECRLHRAQGGEKLAANAIRKSLRLTLGVIALKDIPRADYEIAMRSIRDWDDYKVMKGIREACN